jgi:hypothetical protein
MLRKKWDSSPLSYRQDYNTKTIFQQAFLKETVTAQLGCAVTFRAREESGGVESGAAALNTPISPLFGAEALLRRLA